jgi:hypothetical protein
MVSTRPLMLRRRRRTRSERPGPAVEHGPIAAVKDADERQVKLPPLDDDLSLHQPAKRIVRPEILQKPLRR